MFKITARGRIVACRMARFAPIIVYLLLVGVFIVEGIGVIFDFPVDDAWIHRVYSRSFAYGHFFSYNDAQEAGMTSPLWVIVTAPAEWLGEISYSCVVLAVKSIGIALGVIIIVLTQKITLLVSRSHISSCLAGLLIAMDPTLIFSGVSGMEPILLVAAWLLAVFFLLKRRCLYAVITVSLLPLIRPEAIGLLPLVLFIFVRKNKIRIENKKHLWFLMLVPIPTLLWVIHCLIATGKLLPNTFYSKAKLHFLGEEVVKNSIKYLSIFSHSSVLLMFVGAIFLFGFIWLIRRRFFSLLCSALLIAPFLYVMGVVSSRVMGSGYYFYRWTDPGKIIITVSFSIGVCILLSHKNLKIAFSSLGLKKTSVKTMICSNILVLFALLITISTILKSIENYEKRIDLFVSDSKIIHAFNVDIGKWIASSTKESDVIAVTDAGGYKYFGKRKTIDLIGLNNYKALSHQNFVHDSLFYSDWLITYGHIYNIYDEVYGISSKYKVYAYVEVPYSEYTLCKCPQQTKMYIFKKR